MQSIENFFSLISREVKGPRSGRFLILSGILAMVFGCGGLQISNLVERAQNPGSVGALISGLIVFISFVLLSVGLVILLIGCIVWMWQNLKGKSPDF